jgi:hypothetical protein
MWIIYKTSNLTNDKFYIGMHKNKKPPYEFDGYFGSNKNLNDSINKVGRENFKRETICVCNSLQEAESKEHEIICEHIELGCWPSMYNLSLAGKLKYFQINESNYVVPCYINLGYKLSDQHKQKISNSSKGKVLSKSHRESLSKALKGRKYPKKAFAPRKPRSQQCKDSMSKSIKGRMWIRKIDDHRIGKVLYPHQTVPDGYEKGMMTMNRNKK